MRLCGTAVRYLDALRENLLLELITECVGDSDLYLLNDDHDGRDLLKLVLEVGFAEQVVQIVVEAVVHLVHDEHFVDLLDDLLLDAVVGDLEAFFADLDDLLLLVEGVEAVGEVETGAGEAVDDGAVGLAAEVFAVKDVGALGLGGGDGASSCVKLLVSVLWEKCELTSETSRKSESSKDLKRHRGRSRNSGPNDYQNEASIGTSN